MDITFDPAKDAANQIKHGLSLAFAANVDWSDVWFLVDDRADYRELREIGYSLIDGRLYCVVYTQRGDTMHIISLRKANRREVKHYADET